MTLSIGRALGRGVARTLSVSGAALALLILAVQFVVVGATNTLVRSALPAELRTAEIGLTLSVPDEVAGALAVGAVLLGVVVSVVGPRALVRERSELNTLSASLVTRQLGRAVLSALVAGVIVSVSVTLGSVLLLLPGLFLAVSFLFVNFAVAVEDARAIPALRRSWALARGERWRLFALVVVAFVAFGTVGAVTSVVSLVAVTAAQAVSVAVTSVLSVAYLGVLAEAFEQLRCDERP